MVRFNVNKTLVELRGDYIGQFKSIAAQCANVRKKNYKECKTLLLQENWLYTNFKFAILFSKLPNTSFLHTDVKLTFKVVK